MNHHVRRMLFHATFLCLFSPSAPAWADTILDFEELSIPGDTDMSLFTYNNKGFTLVAINPPTGFLSGFDAHGANSVFSMGSKALAPYAPTTSPPDNIIFLTPDNSEAFALVSIDLARQFAFDPAPTVSFTGLRGDGTTVTESFTVTTPVGAREFQAFDFTGFTDLVSVSWGQPALAAGLHQFDNIRIRTSEVPDQPSILALCGLSAIGLWMRRRSFSRSPL